MNLRTHYHDFFITRTAFFSGWRGIVMVIIFLVLTKEIIGEILNQGMPLEEVLGIFLIAASFVYLYYRLWKEQEKHTDFLNLLWRERIKLQSGGAINYEETQITSASEVVFFRAVFSFILITSSFPSRYLVPDKDPVARWGVFYSLLSLLLGWWGLPWGPIKTVQALTIGIKGGQRRSVRNLIEELEQKLRNRVDVFKSV